MIHLFLDKDNRSDLWYFFPIGDGGGYICLIGIALIWDFVFFFFFSFDMILGILYISFEEYFLSYLSSDNWYFGE